MKKYKYAIVILSDEQPTSTKKLPVKSGSVYVGMLDPDSDDKLYIKAFAGLLQFAKRTLIREIKK